MADEISVTSQGKPRRRSRESREVRERQILDAAIRCMSRTGFNGASVVQIAHEARLSVGVLYRYFVNKEAILEAIAERDMAEMQALFSNWESMDPVALNRKLMSEVDLPIERNYDRSRSAVLLEMFAEAARNQRVGTIMQDVDKRSRRLGEDLIRHLNPIGADDEEVEIRNEVVRMLMDGMLVRGVLHPDIDRQRLSVTLGKVLNFLIKI